MFTPKNIDQNWALMKLGFIDILNRIGNQWDTPAKIANTAPMEST